MTLRTLQKFWLKITAVGIAGFGPFLFLGTMPAFNEPARWGLDVLAWPLDGFPSYESPEMWFLSALAGGFLVGWGVLTGCLSLWVYDLAPEAVRKSVVCSLIAWFMLDSLGSVTSGNSSNVIWNLLVILILTGPLWRPVSD